MKKIINYCMGSIIFIIILIVIYLYTNPKGFLVIEDYVCPSNFMWMSIDFQHDDGSSYELVPELHVIAEQYDFNNLPSYMSAFVFHDLGTIIIGRDDNTVLIYRLKGTTGGEILVSPELYFADSFASPIDCDERELSKTKLKVTNGNGDLILETKPDLDHEGYQFPLSEEDETYHIKLTRGLISKDTIQKQIEVHFLETADFEKVDKKYSSFVNDKE